LTQVFFDKTQGDFFDPKSKKNEKLRILGGNFPNPEVADLIRTEQKKDLPLPKKIDP